MNNSHSAKGNLESRLGAVLRDVQDRLRALERRRHTDTVMVVESGSNTTVTGTGSASDPYVVNAEAAYTDEQVRDVIGAALVAGTGMTVTVDDVGDTITLDSAAGYTDEQVRDVIGAALVAGTNVTITVNDAGDTITISSAAAYTDEQVRDVIGAALVAGSGITITVNDAGDTITIAASGSSLTVQDENTNVSTAVTQIDFQGAGVTVTSGTGEVIVTIPGGSGSSSANGPDGKPWIHTPPASANAMDDEFNDGTSMSGPVNGLDSKWTKHNLGTSGWTVLDDTKAPGCVFFDIPTGQSTDQGIYQAVPAGDFTATSRFELQYASDRQMWGIFVVDTSGTGIALSLDTGDITYIRTMSAWVQNTAPAGVTPNLQGQFAAGQPITGSIRKASGVYYASVTLGDRVMAAARFEASTTPSAFTAAYVGIGRIYGGGVSKFALDYFRIT